RLPSASAARCCAKVSSRSGAILCHFSPPPASSPPPAPRTSRSPGSWRSRAPQQAIRLHPDQWPQPVSRRQAGEILKPNLGWEAAMRHRRHRAARRLPSRLAACTAAAMAFIAAATPASAQSAADFYKGKTVRIIVGFGVGGGYDVYARMLAPYLRDILQTTV